MLVLVRCGYLCSVCCFCGFRFCVFSKADSAASPTERVGEPVPDLRCPGCGPDLGEALFQDGVAAIRVDVAGCGVPAASVHQEPPPPVLLRIPAERDVHQVVGERPAHQVPLSREEADLDDLVPALAGQRRLSGSHVEDHVYVTVGGAGHDRGVGRVRRKPG